jgi:hypothetical protein
VALGGLLIIGAATLDAEETRPTPPTHSTVGPVEGLRVHGHWTIEVRESDGTLVERREFDNALTIAGATHLANVLGRTLTVGGWQIQTFGSSQLCEDPPGTPSNCFMMESTEPAVANNIFKTLTVSVSANTPAELVLNGSLTAQRDGQVDIVSTGNGYCANSVSPSACPGGTSIGTISVTSTTLGAPISALTGQQVQVNVVISFS